MIVCQGARFAAPLLLSIVSLASIANADTVSTWNGGSGNWGTAAQWTPALVPNNGGGRSYAVTVANGSATLDISPTIDSFLLNGGLNTGTDITTGQYTTLTVNHNATVNGGIAGNPVYGWFDSLAVGQNLRNNGFIMIAGGLTVGGNLQNAGTLIPMGLGTGAGSGFTVGGTLVNTGTLQWGSLDGVNPGAITQLGGISNTGSVFIGPGTVVTVTGPNGINDIPKGASWEIGGQFSGLSQSAFAHLTGIEGSLDVEGTLNSFGNAISPLVLGSNGNTIHNSASFTIGSTFGASVVNVLGNISNTGTIQIANPGPYPPQQQYGPSTLNVAGTLTNATAGTLTVNNPTGNPTFSPGSLNVQTLVNSGNASFAALTTSSAQVLENSGTINIYGDAAGDAGTLKVGTLKTEGGLITVLNNGGTLIVGSGAVPVGFTGYDQLANGIFDAAGGGLLIEGPASLDGTLDIMLGNDFKPIGTVFTILNSGQLTGTFSNVAGLVFDGGRERYLLDYNYPNGDVSLTVENNTTPEPRSALLLVLGFAALAAFRGRRKAARTA